MFSKGQVVQLQLATGNVKNSSIANLLCYVLWRDLNTIFKRKKITIYKHNFEFCGIFVEKQKYKVFHQRK